MLNNLINYIFVSRIIKEKYFKSYINLSVKEKITILFFSALSVLAVVSNMTVEFGLTVVMSFLIYVVWHIFR